MRTLGITLTFLLVAAVAAGAGKTTQPHEQQTPTRPSSAEPVIEEGFVGIGGIAQWVSIRGEDPTAPVILVVHGGPGAAWSGMLVPQFAAWEKKFTLVLWDQRGAGRTFGRSGPVGESITIERMAQDGIEVVQHVRQRLHKRRVILMGISWGSVVAVHMAKARPDLFDACVGVGQVVTWRKNEALAYQQLLSKARRAGKTTAVESLETIGPPPYSSLRSTGIRSNLAAHFEPGAPDGPELMKMPFAAPGYTQADAQHWLDGLESSQEHFFGAKMDGPFTQEDLTALGRDFAIPIFILQGTEDDIAPASLAKDYADSIRAPSVQFIPIEGAGHYAFMTRSDFVLQELIRRVRPLAAAD